MPPRKFPPATAPRIFRRRKATPAAVWARDIPQSGPDRFVGRAGPAGHATCLNVVIPQGVPIAAEDSGTAPASSENPACRSPSRQLFKTRDDASAVPPDCLHPGYSVAAFRSHYLIGDIIPQGERPVRLGEQTGFTGCQSNNLRRAAALPLPHPAQCSTWQRLSLEALRIQRAELMAVRDQACGFQWSRLTRFGEEALRLRDIPRVAAVKSGINILLICVISISGQKVDPPVFPQHPAPRHRGQ